MTGVPRGQVDGYGIKTMLRPTGEYFLSYQLQIKKEKTKPYKSNTKIRTQLGRPFIAAATQKMNALSHPLLFSTHLFQCCSKMFTSAHPCTEHSVHPTPA